MVDNNSKREKGRTVGVRLMEFDVKIEKEHKQFCEANKKQLKLTIVGTSWDQWRLQRSKAFGILL